MVVEPLLYPQMDDTLETTMQHAYVMQCLPERLLGHGMMVLPLEKENLLTGHPMIGLGDDGIGLYHLGIQANEKIVRISAT